VGVCFLKRSRSTVAWTVDPETPTFADPMMTHLLRAFCLFLLVATARAQEGVFLADLFGDGMVLQRESTIRIFGSISDGDAQPTISATWPGGDARPIEIDGSTWSVEFETGAAGGPFEVRIDGHTALSDVWLGEVWLCSGQSNMVWPVSASDPGSATLAGSSSEPANWNQPSIHLFELPQRTSPSPQGRIEAEWRRCTPETAQSFSAVALHFATVLHQELDVPIGLVGSHWGGTRAEAWTRESSLAGFSGLQPGLERLRQARLDRMTERFDAATLRWIEELSPRNIGPGSALPEEGWEDTTLPRLWRDLDGENLGGFDGLVTYRREIGIPASWVGREVVISLGAIDDVDVTTIDDQVFATTGAGSWKKPRRYRWRRASETATLVVRALDTGGAGGFSGTPDQMFMHPVGSPELKVSLTEGWQMLRGAPIGELPTPPPPTGVDQNTPAALYNGMIAPLVGFRFAGVIWYQGESNRTRYEEYRALFPAMISDWRGAFDDDLPFYFVQIAPFGYAGDSGQAAELREAQRGALNLHGTGMAVTMDIGDPRDIHPRNKHEVGRRLALWAMARTYGRDELVHSGPLPERLYRGRDGAVHVRFDHAGGGLAAPGGALKLFKAAGRDGAWHPARAEIVTPDTLAIRCEAVEGGIVAVRYAWGAADAAELFNAEGLPASSFRVSL